MSCISNTDKSQEITYNDSSVNLKCDTLNISKVNDTAYDRIAKIRVCPMYVD